MRFFFHQQTGDGLLEDPDGTELANIDAAIAEALVSARYLWADAIVRQIDLTGETFEIADEAGRQVASVSFTDALPPSLRPGAK